MRKLNVLACVNDSIKSIFVINNLIVYLTACLNFYFSIRFNCLISYIKTKYFNVY